MSRRTVSRIALFAAVAGVTAVACRAPARAQATARPPVPTVDAGRPDAGPAPEALAQMLHGAVQRLVDQAKADGLARLAARDYPGALRQLSSAHELAPGDPEVCLELGRLHALVGQRAVAERYLRDAMALDAGGVEAQIALAALQTEAPVTDAGLDEASSLLRAARLRVGQDGRVILWQARVAAARGRAEEARRFYADYRRRNPPDDALRLELGDFERDQGSVDAALQWYRQVGEGDPGLQRTAARRIFELTAAHEARALSLTSRSPATLRRAQAQLAQARRLQAADRWKEAQQVLRALLQDAPLFGPAHTALGDIAVARGDQAAAERAYLRAIALGVGDGETYAALGELYARFAPTPHHAEAAVMLARALASRPDLRDLELPLAESLRATGDLRGALAHALVASRDAPEEMQRARAAVFVSQLRAALDDGAQGPDPRAASRTHGPQADDAVAALGRARTHLAAGATEAALAALRGLPAAARGVDNLNLEARILVAAGHDSEARGVLQRSLSLDPTQAPIHAALGELWLRKGQTAAGLAALERAHALGDAAAGVRRISLLAGDAAPGPDALRLWSLRALRAELSALDTAASGPGAQQARTALLARLDTRIARGIGLWAGLCLFCLLGAFGSWWWRFGGVGLGQLARQHPQSVPQLRTILLSLRHEVLKHNTTMLAGLAESLRGGAPDAELARHLQRALFGNPGGEPAAPGKPSAARRPTDGGAAQAAWPRLRAYVGQLQQVGRSHGVRLNLRHRDPALSNILAGFQRLLGQRARLAALGEGRAAADRRLLTALREANLEINERGYGQLQSLLRELQVFELTQPDLRAVFDAVCREPSLAAREIAPLRLDVQPDALPRAVMLARHDFNDILTNLFRNAIEATLRDAPGDAVLIGLRVEVQTDDITGLQRLLLHVLDAARESLSTDDLRNQAIERGLGLTADRIRRYDGSMEVRAVTDPPFEKAVIVGLPLAE